MTKPNRDGLQRLSVLITIVLALGTVVYAVVARSEQIDRNTADIKALRRTVDSDHDILIRIDANVASIKERLQRMETNP